MSEIHFRSNFWPYQINTQVLFIFKCLTKWLPSAILDVRNSLSIAFLAISDRCTTLFFFAFFYKMAAVGHFRCPKFTFDRISGYFRSIRICKLGFTLRPWIDRQQGNRGFNNAGPSRNQNGGETQPQQGSRFSQNRNSGARPQNPIRKQTPIGEINCWTCGKAGHYASDCKTNGPKFAKILV